jgi:hypothetical protein
MIKDILSYMTQSRHSLSPVFLSLISLLAILGSVAYLIIGLTTFSIVLVLIISIICCYFVYRIYQKNPVQGTQEKNQNRDWTLISSIVVYSLCFFGGMFILFSSRSILSLISPWQVISPIFFLLYGIGTATLLIATSQIRNRFESLLVYAHLFWSFSVALIIYSIGYGYDPFIHQAAVKAIEQLGRIYPTTFYYLGQYSFVSIFHFLFGGSISFWDKILVPVLAPLILVISFIKLKSNQTIQNYRSVLLLLIFSFSIFIVTTPQNLAYIFLIAIIFWSIKLQDSKELIIIWLLAVAACVTQPVAGIPAILLALSVTSEFIKFPFTKKVSSILLATAYCLSLPIAFYIFSKSNTEVVMQWQWPDFKTLFSFLIPENPIKEQWWLNSLYFFQGSQGLIFLITLAAGVYTAIRAKLWLYIKRFGLPLIALLFSAILSASFNFHFLIDYERSDYPQRILFVAGLFSLPFILLALETFIAKLETKTNYIKICWLILLSLMVTASLYFSYPRVDNYYNSHGYATASADVEAVRWIDQHGKNQDYIVLANQQVSAAALREFGFKKYYNSLFYYPIPTGGPLYQYYLQMVTKPEQSTIEAAMKATGVTKAYFVLNDYWWAADKLGPEAEAIADTSVSLQNGQIYIFEYTLK